MDDDFALNPEYLYHDCMCMLHDIKLSQGPLCVASTLKKRPKLAEYVLQHQVDTLDYLEDQIKALTASS